MCGDLYFRGNMSDFETSFLAPLRKALNITDVQGNAGAGEAFSYIAAEYDSYYDYASRDCTNAKNNSAEAFVCQTMGYPSANGYNIDSQVGPGGYMSRFSWAVPSGIFNKADPAKTKQFFADPSMQLATGHVIGGKVNKIGADATSVHPSMRSSGLELLLQPSLQAYVGGDPTDMSMATFRAAIQKYVPPPTGTPIFNHDARNLAVLKPLGAPHKLNWQQMYWGSNLPRLQCIKAHYDPDALFTCRDCLTADPTASCPTSSSSSSSAIASASAAASSGSASYVISATVSLSGVSKSQFTGGAVKAFKSAIVLGFSGFTLTIESVIIDMDLVVDVPGRRTNSSSLSVPFKVRIPAANKAAADNAATGFSAYLKNDASGGFLSTLKKKVSDAGLTGQFDVKAVKVTSEPAATAASKSSSSSSSFAGWKIALIVVFGFLFLVMIVGGIIFVFMRRSGGNGEGGTAHRGPGYKTSSVEMPHASSVTPSMGSSSM